MVLNARQKTIMAGWAALCLALAAQSWTPVFLFTAYCYARNITPEPIDASAPAN